MTTSLLHEALRQMQHPSGTMDDPLTAAYADSMDEAALGRFRAHEADDEAAAEALAAERRRIVAEDYEQAISIPRSWKITAAVALAAVAAYFLLVSQTAEAATSASEPTHALQCCRRPHPHPKP